MDELERTDIKIGLSSQEARQRMEAGQGNRGGEVPTKSVGRILRDNLITPFNLLNFVLALLVILVGSWKNVLFLGVIFWNIVIGTVQELRAKRTVDRLTLLSAPRARVRRDGRELELPLEELVLGDILLLAAGDQVGADCLVAEGTCRMDESLLTGESEPVERAVGEVLLSGSFLASGKCTAQVIHVGRDNYASQITADAKYIKKPESEIMDTINRIIRVIGFALIPIGLALFCKQYFLNHIGLAQAVVSTVAALVGMIPEGLVLLTSVVLAVSVVRLARRQALVHELHSIEMLARVDVLCLDKTGTLTTGDLAVERLEALPGREEEARAALGSILAATGDENPTAAALRAFLGEKALWAAEKAAPFRSDRKWSGGQFGEQGTWVLGAPQFVLPQAEEPWAQAVETWAGEGLRVLVLARSQAPFGPDDTLPPQPEPIALLALSDQLRPSAGETLSYFAQQGVTLKVISGDDPRTVSSVARRAGLVGAESWVDASTLATEEATRRAAEEYTVFGRVTPRQKLWLVQELQARGHHVAMTGDGVNDVLALKESDCGVAMAAGSEAARNVSRIVLMDSDFSAMPHIVAEGRRAINNLQRSASLFLTKTMFSAIIALCFLFLSAGYPFQPIQLTLISALTIGAPSFVLALEPNRERIRGRFRDNVFSRAIPGAATMAAEVLLTVAATALLGLSHREMSTLCVLLVGFTGLLNLAAISRPLNLLRGLLLGAMTIGFCGGAYLLRELFSLSPLPGKGWLALAVLMAVGAGLMLLLTWAMGKRQKSRT